MRAAGPVVEVRLPLIGRIWMTTTQEMASLVLKDSQMFTLRKDDGAVAGLRWWMPGIFRNTRTVAMDIGCREPAKPMNGINAPQRPDCVAGHVRLELRNVVANYPFERSHRFPEIQPNSGHGDYSRLSCSGRDAQLGS